MSPDATPPNTEHTEPIIEWAVSADTYELGSHDWESFESPIISAIQSILASTDIPTEHKSQIIFKGKKVFYLETPDWIWLAEHRPAVTKKIKKQFYDGITPIAESLSKASGIPVDIYLMIVAKESWFLTSCPAQIANNPLHMNNHQDNPDDPKSTPKTDIIGEYPTVEWIDDERPYHLFIFKNIPDAFGAFEKLMHFWARLKYKTNKTQLTRAECIALLVDYWKSGINGDQTHFEQWLKRIEDRR